MKAGMIMVYDYEIIQKDTYYYIKSGTKPTCTQCKAPLMVRGSKKRYLITESGEKICFHLKQLYCRNCHKIHLECPSIIVPYKHYSQKAIIGAISHTCNCCGAENSTIQRWKAEWE